MEHEPTVHPPKSKTHEYAMAMRADHESAMKARYIDVLFSGGVEHDPNAPAETLRLAAIKHLKEKLTENGVLYSERDNFLKLYDLANPPA